MTTTPMALVVDDSPEVARVIHRLVRQVLLGHGWDVRYTTDPQQGLNEVLRNEAVRLVFVDSVMPLLNGDDFVESALAHRPKLRGRIVVCSGLWFEEHREKRLFEELGCLRLDKPFRLDALACVVWQVLALP